jgi:hypothetical protein
MALGAFLLFLPYCVSEEGGAVVADARDPTSAFPSGDDGEWVDCGSVLFSPTRTTSRGLSPRRASL